MEEITNFIAQYLDDCVDVRARDLPRNIVNIAHETNDANLPSIFSPIDGYAPNEGVTRFLAHLDHQVAHSYVLLNCGLLGEYERIFEAEMVKQHPHVRTDEVWAKFEDRFAEWFREYIFHSDVNDDVIRALAYGPKRHARCWDHYYVNGFNFHTYEYGKNKSTMNYGVCVKGTDGKEYYGILQDVIELQYVGDSRSYRTILFKCDWYDCVGGIVVHETYKLVDVNHTKRYPKYDPFVLASQVIQVCYMSYPMKDNSRKDWVAVVKIKPRSIIDAPEEDTPFQIDGNENVSTLGNVDVDDDMGISEDEENVAEESVGEAADGATEGDEEDSHDGVYEEEDNVSEDEDEYFADSIFK